MSTKGDKTKRRGKQRDEGKGKQRGVGNVKNRKRQQSTRTVAATTEAKREMSTKGDGSKDATTAANVNNRENDKNQHEQHEPEQRRCSSKKGKTSTKGDGGKKEVTASSKTQENDNNLRER